MRIAHFIQSALTAEVGAQKRRRLRLYHSFPRISAVSGNAETEAGIGVLRGLIEHGILLTPEILGIPPNHRASTKRPRIEFPQERACFTLASLEDLLVPPGTVGRKVDSHLGRFGDFSIGLDPIRARSLGVIPTFYFYHSDSANIGYEILFRLRELRTLMVALARIEARAAIPGRDSLSESKLEEIGFTLEDQPKLNDELSKLSPNIAKAVVDALDTDRVPAWNLVDWIDILLSHFQLADSQKNPGSLYYYQQREWRIVRLFAEHIQCYPISLDRQSKYPKYERAALLELLGQISPEFFSKQRVNNTSVLIGTRDQSFFDFVEEIVVPVDCKRQVMDLLKDYGLEADFRPTFRYKGYQLIERGVDDLPH